MPLFQSSYLDLKPDWIDHNGHLNMAYYSVLFDLSLDPFQEGLGLGPAYVAACAHTTYTAEFRIRYRRELHPGARVRSSVRVLDVSDRAYHYAQELLHEEGWIAATGEGVSLHVDQGGPRVAPWPPQIHAALCAARDAHADSPRPDWIGAPMGLRR
ncbi:thioesterase family protein [Pseudooceanicola sp. CBS1P-1]|uniref:Thioesterase n=1 Tax=Pseudooceanicola albus TaxID=2692189 RepID=A0A6L7FYF4_9RHOB|nr:MULTISPECIES: thioesterase family protein [Pseudooceanicola]MBT9382563.1 thioesterase family protein [Pseudooceanicola endophyticus]MXN17104.1 thioesterase [Pseudooceanicola albus]